MAVINKENMPVLSDNIRIKRADDFYVLTDHNGKDFTVPTKFADLNGDVVKFILYETYSMGAQLWQS